MQAFVWYTAIDLQDTLPEPDYHIVLTGQLMRASLPLIPDWYPKR